jgi:hypothetical protein
MSAMNRFRIERYICAGSSAGLLILITLLFAISIMAVAKRADFDGDGKTDISVYRPSTGTWYIKRSNGSGLDIVHYGTSGLICLGDFDGRGVAGFLFPGFTPTVPPPSYRQPIGSYSNGDRCVYADYDGDRKDDQGYWRPSTGQWNIQLSSGGTFSYAWGIATDLPVPGYYSGPGTANMAIYRPENGTWYIVVNAGVYNLIIPWGAPGDKPVNADYNGDGVEDIAVYRPSNGTWYILFRKGDGFEYYVVNWGLSDDIPVPGDYDGDGKYDIAQFRPSTGTWYVLGSRGGFLVENWGGPGDVPLPALYLPNL